VGVHFEVTFTLSAAERAASSAAPTLLSGVVLDGKVVTGDALFTQRDLSAAIVEAGGDYVWLVNDNQPRLRAAIERLFGPDVVLPASALLKTDFQAATTTTKAHESGCQSS